MYYEEGMTFWSWDGLGKLKGVGESWRIYFGNSKLDIGTFIAYRHIILSMLALILTTFRAF